MRTILFILLFTLTGCSFSFSSFAYSSPGYHRRQAEQFKTEGKLLDAIKQYELHIQQRYSDTNRSDKENPSFYYILIGDIYLEMDEPESALQSYLKAREDGIMVEFIIDRVRRVSKYYEDAGELDNALKLLNAHRDLDTLLFDWDIDRLHKAIVNREQQNESFQQN